MKIIHIHDVRIIMNSRTEYKIQTPLGILTDINDAVELYPYLTEDKKVRQCPICKQYFVKYGREDNAKQYWDLRMLILDADDINELRTRIYKEITD